jgi:hypothetical protein
MLIFGEDKENRKIHMPGVKKLGGLNNFLSIVLKAVF